MFNPFKKRTLPLKKWIARDFPLLWEKLRDPKVYPNVATKEELLQYINTLRQEHNLPIASGSDLLKDTFQELETIFQNFSRSRKDDFNSKSTNANYQL